MKARPIRWALVATASGLVCASPISCSFDDSAAPKPYSFDSGTDATLSDGGGGGDSSTQGLCTKLGGYANVAPIADDIIANATADCRIGPYFTMLDAPSRSHLTDCFRTYVGATFDCMGVTYVGAKDSQGQDCRDMTEAHKNMNLTADDYNAFLDDVIKALQTHNVTTADSRSVVDQFNGVTGVYNPRKEGNAMCTCPPAMCKYPPDAGKDTGTDATDDGPTETSTDAPVDSPPPPVDSGDEGG